MALRPNSEKANKRGYVAKQGAVRAAPEPHGKKRSRPTASRLKSAEDVKLKFLLPFLEERGYKKDCVRLNVPVAVREGRKVKAIFADAVVCSSPKGDSPLVLCETKAPNEVLDGAVRDQAISHARLLPRIVPLTLITNGSKVQVFQTVTKKRLPALPHREELAKNVVNFVLSRHLQEALRCEAKNDLLIIDGRRTIKRLLSAPRYVPTERPPCLKCGKAKRLEGREVCKDCLAGRPRPWQRPEVDALFRRLPGSFGTGKRR